MKKMKRIMVMLLAIGGLAVVGASEVSADHRYRYGGGSRFSMSVGSVYGRGSGYGSGISVNYGRGYPGGWGGGYGHRGYHGGYGRHYGGSPVVIVPVPVYGGYPGYGYGYGYGGCGW